MRIESITKDNLEKENDNELFNLRMRFTQLFKKFYKTNLFKKSDFNFLERKDFLERYKLLSSEIKSRKLKVNKSSELDKVIFSKDMVGVDVKSLPDIPVMNDYISITGSFLKSPKSIGEFSIYVRDTADKRLVEVEERVRQVLEEELGKSPAIMKHEEPEDDYLPIYELVLKPKERLEKIKHEEMSKKSPELKKDDTEELGKAFPIKKPEETDTTIRIPISDCEVTATITISASEGIKALYCGKEKKIRTYIFDKAKGWTMTKAKKWIKEHKEKMDKEENEHSARLQDPKKYDDWRRTKGGKIYFKIAIPASISIVWGHPKDKPARIWVPQALRFPKDKYTVAQAKKFLSDNKIKYISFEAAKKEEKKEKIEKIEERNMTIRFLKADEKEYIAGGIVSACEEIDSQGDVISKAEIWKGMKSWMLKGGKVRIMHKGKAQAISVIECYQADEPHHKGGNDKDHLIGKGDWYISLYLGASKETKEIFKRMVAGELNSFSIGGVAASKDN